MDLKWDEKKRNRIIKDRKVDLLYAALIFEGDILTRIDNIEDYGELREITLGMAGDEFSASSTQRAKTKSI